MIELDTFLNDPEDSKGNEKEEEKKQKVKDKEKEKDKSKRKHKERRRGEGKSEKSEDEVAASELLAGSAPLIPSSSHSSPLAHPRPLTPLFSIVSTPWL